MTRDETPRDPLREALLREDRHLRLHPDDGYAYDGCEGFACRTLRAALASSTQDALDEAIEAFLGVERPSLSAGPDSIKTYELALQRFRIAYGVHTGRVTSCPVRSSITDQPCVLPDGHRQDSADRFHRYAARGQQ